MRGVGMTPMNIVGLMVQLAPITPAPSTAVCFEFVIRRVPV
jgi:hypothetical protein